MPSPSRGKSSRRNEASRRAILDAALALGREKSYAELTIEGIAARAHVGKQTIYRWWPSKGAVLCEALMDLDAADERDTTAGSPESDDLAADLRRTLSAAAADLTDPHRSEALRSLAAEAAMDPALTAAYGTVLDGPGRDAALHRLRRAREAGQIDGDTDLDIAVDLLWAPMRCRWLYDQGALDADFTDTVVEVVLKGLGWTRD
ncbi:TetR/AcrR family transcriptional regulator [Streptomyces sp. RY43-2]|uniref:TetR/AcrR family transcriptional regulator n=1 Tax=Streptomyces macrolidinus TaxID=2952607 RepID=A0ABT0ZMM9_9ACTN|nr:TetR/AcrR family transcriptional regulator [Streptomyces macrolidinus]MCN9244793.1 TetR/AcrR family transcriptional regulator [Streptomyces macrolidinus]